MALDTTVKVKRAGVTGTQDLLVQIDPASVDEIGYTGNESPADAYKIYLKMAWAPGLIQREDFLIDTGTSNTGTYKVVNKPVGYPDGHAQIKAILKVGT